MHIQFYSKVLTTIKQVIFNKMQFNSEFVIKILWLNTIP